MKLSKNFTLEEMTKSQAAIRKRIRNVPTEVQLRHLKLLCAEVLQKIRNNFGPVHVSSGYRSPKLNKAIGGSETSQHCKGQAADIEVPGLDNRKLADWIKANLLFDQLILEFYKDGVPDSGWIHVSYKPENNRKQCLRAVKEKRRTKYYHDWL